MELGIKFIFDDLTIKVRRLDWEPSWAILDVIVIHVKLAWVFVASFLQLFAVIIGDEFKAKHALQLIHSQLEETSLKRGLGVLDHFAFVARVDELVDILVGRDQDRGSGELGGLVLLIDCESGFVANECNE